MTNEAIINAAFRVWGREAYQSTSLSRLARELGVSKPALYRHFKNKQALLNAMEDFFFDAFTASIKEVYEQALMGDNITEGWLICGRAIADFYIRHRDMYIFCLVHVYGSKNNRNVADKMALRGVDLRKLQRFEEGLDQYPPPFQLIIATLTFWTSYFHRYECSLDEAASEEMIEELLNDIEQIISWGLGFTPDQVNTLDFSSLEARIPRNLNLCPSRRKGLFTAIAGAVAEAGPWDASMDMIARRSGMAKSSLYTHFKSRKDMLGQFFSNEFERIAVVVDAAVAASAVPEEQLYLAISAIAVYLQEWPEILNTINWIRTRRIDLGQVAMPRIVRLFSGIQLPGGAEGESFHKTSDRLSLWILFLVVNVLMRHPQERSLEASLQTLYRFITLGMRNGAYERGRLKVRQP